jgi:hypothetical protein
MESEVRELCKKLKPVLGRKVDALWYTYLTEDMDGNNIVAWGVVVTCPPKTGPGSVIQWGLYHGERGVSSVTEALQD